MAKTTLKKSPTLSDMQLYIKAVCEERGWDKVSHLETFLLFSEEVGELAKAIRNHRQLFQECDRTHTKFELEEEFADVLSYLLDLANQFDIDLETAFRKKEQINSQRVWKTSS